MILELHEGRLTFDTHDTLQVAPAASSPPNFALFSTACAHGSISICVVCCIDKVGSRWDQECRLPADEGKHGACRVSP